MNSNDSQIQHINSVIPDYVKEAIKIIENASLTSIFDNDSSSQYTPDYFEAWLVGGFVRDCLLKKECFDIDITTNATPKQIEQIFEKAGWHFAETGLQHGTITVIKPQTKETIEVTTFRCETTYSDSRHPDNVEFVQTIQEDLSRRDFTINAIAFNPTHGFVDPYQGINDINTKIIKAVGDPKVRFNEDALRILRAVRFQSQLGFEIENRTSVRMIECLPEVDKISRERVRDEVTKLLCGEYAADVLEKYPEIICNAIPEMKPCVGFDQHTKYHSYDVYKHTSVVVQNIPKDKYIDELDSTTNKKINEILKWASLLHDIGKPEVFFTDKQGQGHFYTHPEVSETIAKKVLRRLKFSNEYVNAITVLVRWHDNPTSPTQKSVIKMLRRIEQHPHSLSTEILFRLLCDLRRADTKGHAPQYANNTQETDAVEQVFEKILEQKIPYSVTQLKIGGDDLIKLGCKPGPRISEILKLCMDAVINNQIKNEHQDLLAFANKQIMH